MAIEFKNIVEGLEVLDAAELTAEELAEHDYLDLEAIEDGRDSASFVRYAGTVYNLADFSADWGISRGAGLPSEFAAWHGFLSDSSFSGVVIRYEHDVEGEPMTLATFYVTG